MNRLCHRTVTALIAAAGLPLLLAGCTDTTPPPAAPAAPTTPTAQGEVSVPAMPSAPATTAPVRPGQFQVAPPAHLPEPEDAKIARFADVEGPKPATWLWQPPSSAMYAADYVVPAQGGSGNQMHLVVFQGIGGGLEMNVTRWVGQFRPTGDADGPAEPVKALRSSFKTVGNLPVDLIEIAGAYQGMGMPAHRDGHTMLMAVVTTPATTLHVRLVGETTSINENREAFMALVQGLHVIGTTPSP